MTDEWSPLIMLIGAVAVGAWATLTARRGVIEYLGIDFRRDERPLEFWMALLVLTAGAAGVLFGLFVVVQ